MTKMSVEFTESSLLKVGVEIVDYERIMLRCKVFGAEFSPELRPGAKRMPKRWWRCPNGCNAPRVCALCEKGVKQNLGLVRACKECGKNYLLCFECSEKFKSAVFPCCLVVIPGKHGVFPRSVVGQLR